MLPTQYPPQGFPVPAAIPSGLIAMWHGSIANIPSGWVICDGNNGTPNLLAKFIEGVATAATNPGTTGGATAKTTAGHIHTMPTHIHEMPTHIHTMPTHRHTMPTHTHTYDTKYKGGTGTPYNYLLEDINAVDPGDTNLKDPGDTHATDPGDTNSAAPGDTNSKTDSIADIRPAFYDVAFIMKT